MIDRVQMSLILFVERQVYLLNNKLGFSHNEIVGVHE